MSPSPIDNLPLGTIAAILQNLAQSRWPRQDKPTIASRYGLTIPDLQTLLQRHDVQDLDAGKMLRKAHELLEQESTEPAEVPAVSRETSDPDQDSPDPGTRQRLVRVRVDQLRADPNNLREHLVKRVPDDELDANHGNVDDIDQLAESIRESGLLQPIVVREVQTYAGETPTTAYTIVMGHRRAAALRRLRWTTTEVIIRPPMRPDEVLAAMLIENGQRAGLDPIEEARGIRQLATTHGWTDAQIAHKIGRSQNYVSTRLALLHLSAEDQERIRNREMGVTAGGNLGRLNSGHVRRSSKGHVSVDWYGPTHELASKARARCNRLAHPGRKIAGGEACGACWESVIRADERDHLQQVNATADNCVTCGEPIDADRVSA